VPSTSRHPFCGDVTGQLATLSGTVGQARTPQYQRLGVLVTILEGSRVLGALALRNLLTKNGLEPQVFHCTISREISPAGQSGRRTSTENASESNNSALIFPSRTGVIVYSATLYRVPVLMN
jgi:hypothetical protein